MSTPEDKKCPKNVLEIKQKRSREQGKLHSLLNRAQKKLAQASAGEEAPRRDVTAAPATPAAQEEAGLPYYLLQPRAKSGPPRHPPYLGSGEVIVLRDQQGQQGWHRARLTSHTGKYKNSSYEWGYYVQPANPAHQGDADEVWAYLEPGADWGVLRGVDIALDLSKLQLCLPDGQQLAHTITSICERCDGGEIKVYREEVEYLQGKLPFKCTHGRWITSFQPGASTVGLALCTPRPGFPLLPASGGGIDATRRLAAPSTVASTVDADRLTLRRTEVESQFGKLVDAHSDLRDALKNCSLGEVVGYEELEKDEMDNYLKTDQAEVDDFLERAQEAVDSLIRLADFNDEDEAARAEQQEAARLEQQMAATRQEQVAAARQEQAAAARLEKELARQEQVAAARRQQDEVARQEQVAAARQEQAAAARREQEEVARQEQVAAARREQEEVARQEQAVAARRQEVARLEQEGPGAAAAREEQLARQRQLVRQEEAIRLEQLGGQQLLRRPSVTLGLLEPPPLVYRSRFASTLADSSDEQLRPALSPLQDLSQRSMGAAPAPPPSPGGRPSPLPPPVTPRRSSAVEFYQQAISPEKQEALKMKRSRLDKEKEEIEDRLVEYEAKGSNKFKADVLEAAILKTEKLLTEVLLDFSLQLRAAAFSPSSRPAQARVRLHDEMYAWLRQARRRNWAAVPEPEPPAVQQLLPTAGAAHLERAKLPRFDAKPENYAEFKRRFQELVRAVKSSPVLEMTYLVDHLAPEAARYVRGVREPDVAWAKLDKRYGNRQLAIMTARHQLASVKLPKGPAFDQVEALVQELCQAKERLAAVQAEDELFADAAMMGTLLGKLPPAVQTMWYTHRVTLAEASAVENGRIFEQWLERQGDAATLQRLTMLATELGRGLAAPAPPAPGTEKQTCGRCHRPGHSANSCPPDPPLRDPPAGGRRAENFFVNSGGSQKFANKEEAEAAAGRAAARIDPCPACQGAHSFTRSFNSGAFSISWPSYRLESCPEFIKLAPTQRARMVEAQGGCCLCTATLHKSDKCFSKNTRTGEILCTTMVAGKACGKRHHHLLHGSNSSYCQALTSSSQAQPSSKAPAMPGSGSLFELLDVPVAEPGGVPYTSTLMMVDPGSTDNFISHKLAAELKLTGTPHTLFIRVLDQEFREKPTMIYHLDVLDGDGVAHRLEAIGMRSLTEVQEAPEVFTLSQLFPEAPPAAAAAFRRPSGVVHLMLGMKDRRLHSTDGLECGDLRLCRTVFNPGWVLTGFSSHLAAPAPHFSSEVLLASLATSPPRRPVQNFFLSTRSGPSMGCIEAEELGCTPAPACSSCRGCRECSFRRKVLTTEDAGVLARIEREMERNPETGVITASYPWKPCKERMRDNRNQVEKIQKRIESSMHKDGTFEAYREEMEKAFASGAVRELTSAEMQEWRGPVHFLTLFPIHKASSVSTRLRIVSNSALVNAISGLSLNDCLWSGPNAMAELLAVLVHWRTVEVALVTDIVKAYHVIRTREDELHLRRFLWREAPSLPWRVCAYTRATFGDLPAGLLLEVVKRRAAELGMEVDALAAQQILDNSYVDDIILGGDRDEVERMRGNLLADGQYSGTITQILATCGMRPKFIAVSGDQDPAAAEPLGGKVLGLGYHLGRDKITFKIELNFFQKMRGKKVAVALTREELEQIRRGTKSLSRRATLSLLQGWFDPLGLLSPALLKGKQLLRRLHNPSLDWDDEIPAAEQLAWADWLQELVTSEEVTFPRSTTPPGHRGAPSLAAFADSSLSAYCAVVYVVWEVEGGSFTSRLLLGKCRLTALRGTTIPRGELCAVVVMARLLLLASLHLATPIHRISMSTDSECVIKALAKSGSSFPVYWQNRVSEVAGLREELATRCSTLEEVTHIPSSLNPADLGTRGTVSLADLGPGSLWQCGPSFLTSPRDQWPLQQELSGARITVAAAHCTAAELTPTTAELAPSTAELVPTTAGPPPEQLGVRLQLHLARGQRLQRLVFTCLSKKDLATSTRLLARVLRALLTGDRAAILATPCPQDVAAARQLLLLAASPSAFAALRSGRLLSLGAQEHRGLVVVRGRVGQAHLARLLGTSSLPVVMPSELLALRVTEEAHREDHRMTVRDVTARVRRTIFVPGGNKLAKSVCSRCMVCRTKNRIMNKQIMGDLPEEKLSAAAPFVYTAVDMFGPWKVREMAGGRRFFKCWGVMFSCLATKAVCILACPGYSTAAFATTYRMFTAIYSHPTKVFTDHGPQLVAHAGAEELSLGQVAEEAGKRGTEWVFSPKACSWRNGQAEVCIRLARHTLSHLLSSTSTEPMDVHSLGATFLEVAAILNRRPIAVRYASATDYHSISPSDILLGRAHWLRPDLAALPHLPQDLAARRALDHQQAVVAAWQEQWQVQAFPEMIPRSTWKQEYRSVKVGDVGHILYKHSLGKSAFRLCRVITTSPDAHGVVRTCTVAFRPRHVAERGQQYVPKEPIAMDIGVQRFSVLLPVELQSDATFSLSPERPTAPLGAPPAPLGAPLAPLAAPPAGWQGGRAAHIVPLELQSDESSLSSPSPLTQEPPASLGPEHPSTISSPLVRPCSPVARPGTPMARPSSPAPSSSVVRPSSPAPSSPMVSPGTVTSPQVSLTAAAPAASPAGTVSNSQDVVRRRQPARRCKTKAGVFHCFCK